MVIKYWTDFSKREDETLLPAGAGTQITVTLKEPCSILRPSFILSSNISGLNYIRVDAWGRYYFVTEKTYISNDTYRIDCVYDPLASYKTQIGSYTGNVEYTSSSSNILINDPRNRPTYETIEKYGDLYDLTSDGFNTTGSYVVGIVSNEGVNYYAMSTAQLSTMCSTLYDHTFASQISNTFFDMKNCIVSCVWMPYTPVDGTLSPIFLSNVQANEVGQGYLIAENKRIRKWSTGLKSFTKPATDLGYSSSYLDYAPYTEGALYLPFVGNVPLDLDVYAEQSSLRILISIDQFTGDIVYSLMRSAGDVISTYQGNFGVSVPIAGQSYNALGAIGSGISMLGGVATVIGGAVSGNAGMFAGGAASLAAGGTSMVQSLSRHTQINGSLSSAVASGLFFSIMYHMILRKPTETNLTSFRSISGMPYFKSATIGNLSGYVKCSGASVPIAGFKEEKDAVNSYLNKGFYYT